MSDRRRRSESLWDRQEEAVPQNETKEFHSSFLEGGLPKLSNLEANDILMSEDFSGQPSRDPNQGNENSDRHGMKTNPAFDEWDSQNSSRPSDNSYSQPNRGAERRVGGKDRDRSRSRSLSPHRSRGRDMERDRDMGRGNTRDQGRARSPSRGGSTNKPDSDSTERWSDRPEHSGGSRFRDDRNSADHSRSKGSDGYRKDATRREEGRDYQRSNRSGYDDQDYRRQSNRSVKDPCKFFIMGQCNRGANCNFSHDLPKSGGHEGKSRDSIQPNDSGNFDDNNKYWNGPSWNSLESGGINEMPRDKWDPPGWNESEKNSSILPQSTSDTYNMDMSSNQESQFTDAHNMISGPFTQSEYNVASQFPSNLNTNESNLQLNGSVEGMFLQLDGEKSENDIPQASGLPQNPNISSTLGSMSSLPISASSGAIIDSIVTNEQNQMSVEPVGNEVNGNKIAENPNVNAGKSEAQGKVEEGNISNDEKAMRQFKIALVEFVKEILKPTWKEGKMSREVYKTIVKKVMEKVTSTIQGVQIPRTQEKIDQYLTFSKSKITKLVEAYVGRLLKA